VGPLALSVDDAVRYYTGEAHDWERQVLIRSRSSAGEPDVYKRFFDRIESAVFVDARTVRHQKDEIGNPQSAIRNALDSVRHSKLLIDREQKTDRGFNVKLGRGGIREIEFIAQALQLAYGGKDPWLRVPHTLISLSRLSDRGLITETELTELFNAYEFLRHLEHILQMENGLQTHSVPDDTDRRALVARRMRCETVKAFNAEIGKHTGNVHRIFDRVFLSEPGAVATGEVNSPPYGNTPPTKRRHPSLNQERSPERDRKGVSHEARRARDEYFQQLHDFVAAEKDFRHRLGAFRRRWSTLLDEIRTAELAGMIDARQSKRAQTALAEASIEAALHITREELVRKYKTKMEMLPIAVMGLGKLGGGAIDYGSDLDLVLVYDGDKPLGSDVTHAEFYSRAGEIFVTTLSSMTRDGSIYRVDLRLRPYGKNGQSVCSATAFTEYMRDTAAIWEWLAYVKIRAVGGEVELARKVEQEVRGIIHSRAAAAHRGDLAAETRRVRLLLEKEKGGRRRAKEVDIKYGPGGMLDVYFAMRFLQLRDNIPDGTGDRSTDVMLGKLHERGALSSSDYAVLIAGYRYLSMLDHGLRLTVGRRTRLPAANHKALESIAARMELDSPAELIERITLHRLEIRSAFERIVAP
ncbi:MAG: hypothetical protein ABI857_12610, partial [Acidobacteriota bacterium]